MAFSSSLFSSANRSKSCGHAYLIAAQPKIAHTIEKPAWNANPIGKKSKTRNASSHHQKSWCTMKRSKKRNQITLFFIRLDKEFTFIPRLRIDVFACRYRERRSQRQGNYKQEHPCLLSSLSVSIFHDPLPINHHPHFLK